MIKRLTKFVFTGFIICLFLGTIEAQVTTSAITGKVTDASGETVIGATVLATHTESGTQYGVVTSDDGRYTIRNMRVGGPYSVAVSYIGYKADQHSNLYLALGEKLNLNFTMVEEGIMAEEVVVIGTLDPLLNNERTGAATSINRDMMDKLPTISRSSEDFTRLNTMSAEGGSFAGRNDQFNNYSLDGAVFNNPFGLDAATPGGQSAAQPVSLDAIEQINVSIAPYDVTQSGFTGASINAVTKSGTNKLKGSVFGFFNNASMTGGKVNGVTALKGDPKEVQAGFAIGGPIIKDKVFFFVNYERQDRSNLGSFFSANDGTTGESVSRVAAADLQLVSNLLRDNYGYDTGAYENFNHDADNSKGLLKLDVNLSNSHKLAVTYNFLDAFRDNPAHPSAIGRRGPDFTTLQFQNSGYRINNSIHSGKVELNSFFGNKISNKFQASYTQFRDSRDPFSDPFPVINIGKDGQRYIIAGHEPFSVHNVLDQDVYQFRNDVSIFSGKHTFTVGTAFERFNFNNSFNLTSYGFRVFGPDIDIADVSTVLTSEEFAGEVQGARDAFSNNNANDSWALAETNLGQISFYGQDEIAVSDKLNLTLGLRLDIPLYFNTATLIQENIDRKGGLIDDGGVYAPGVVYSDADGNDIQFDHTELPSTSPLINPRLGFNYDVNGDRTLQLRGGTGLFSGRFPFVWIGNQVANPDFFFYNMTDPNFKFPQVWRTNIGVDKEFAGGWVGTMDLLYTKDLQAQVVNNFGLKLPGGTLSGADSRPYYRDEDRVQGPFGGATNAYVFTNVSGGYSMNASFSVERSWNNQYVKLGYNYLKATDVNSIDAEISSDAYDRNPANISHTNSPEASPSLYGNQHRIVGAGSKKFNWSDKLGTTVSLFFTYASGQRYSYTYSGDLNNDGSGLNDLLYIPTDSEIDGMNFTGDAGAQRTGLKAYIAQDDYLSSRRGDYAEKYGALSPWFSKWDLRILQDLGIGDDRGFQLSFDILNLGNLINSSWGVRQFATQTSLAQPIAVSQDGGEPTYTFDTAQTQTFFDDFGQRSRWQLQVGLRFNF